MSEAILDERILEELKVAASESIASGRLPAPNWIDEQTKPATPLVRTSCGSSTVPRYCN